MGSPVGQSASLVEVEDERKPLVIDQRPSILLLCLALRPAHGQSPKDWSK